LVVFFLLSNYLRYEPVQTRVVHQLQRLGVKPEDPANYSKSYGNSLLDTEQLLAQIKELGISVDLVCSFIYRY